MIELGASPDEAIAAVRAARSGTIETNAQEEYVRARVAISAAPPSRTSRIAGAMFGVAIGHAQGSAFEAGVTPCKPKRRTSLSNDSPCAFASDLAEPGGNFGEMFWRGGPGGATVRALSRLAAGAEPATCGPPDAGGNGAAMRRRASSNRSSSKLGTKRIATCIAAPRGYRCIYGTYR